MNTIPIGFQSPALAQARLLDRNNYNNLENVTNHVRIEVDNPCARNMLNISTIPSFKASGQNGATRSDFGVPTKQLIKLLERKARSAFEKMMISERGQELLAKAREYNISFDAQNVDFLSLMDEIDEYEALIARSDELNMDWDFDCYDPVGLEQEIEACEFAERQSAAQERAYYRACSI
jgi:hypothetical protein